MKKIALILSLACLSLACAKEAQNPDSLQEEKQVNLQQVTLVAGQEVATKTYFNMSNGVLTWTDHESSMGVYDGTALQTFTHVETTEEGAQASFTGTADVNVATWTAVHPKHHASVADSKVYVTFPPIQTARAAGGMLADINTMAAQVTHDGSGNLDHFTMKNVGGLLKLTVAKAGIKTITVSSRNGEPLTGKAELSFDGSGNPVVTPVANNYETFVTLKADDLNAGLAAGEYFVSVFPVTMTTGLIIDMENIDGTVASVKSSTEATVARSADLEFAGFDTGASWYTPEETTITFNFDNNWPFNEDTTNDVDAAAATAWAGPGEKVMTYKPDNSILCYMHCSTTCSGNGDKGLRFGRGNGDYLLLPAIPGKSLKKVSVTYFKATDSSRPGIYSRGGTSEAMGGTTVTSDISVGSTHEWTLMGTGHNLQYRYQINSTSSTLTRIKEMTLTYVGRPEPLTLDLVFWTGADYIEDGAVNQPFNTNLPIYNTDTDSDFVFVHKENNYTFHFTGGNMRLAVHKQWRGLHLNVANSHIMFPAIPGKRLTKVDGILGGRSYEDYYSASYNPDIPSTHGRYGSKTIVISTTSSESDKIDEFATGSASIVNPVVFSRTLDATSANTSYYLIAVSGGTALRRLKLTYEDDSSAPAPAPASLLDGGETEL